MSLRIGGLASGMDIDSLVEKLMTAERMPLNKLSQKKQSLEWQRDDYRSMNTLLYDLKNFIGVTQTGGIGRQATFFKQVVASTNDSAVMAKNINSTSNMNATIGVIQLADAASMYSTGAITTDSTFDPNALLLTERAKLVTDTGSNSVTITIRKATGEVSTQSFTIDPSADSLNSVLKQINDSTLGVQAFYDSYTKKVSISSKTTGDLTIETTAGDFLSNALSLPTDNTINGTVGKDAIFTYNGLTTQRSSNTFQMNGYEYTLKQVTDTGDGIISSSESITISSQTDVDGIFDSIKKFVDKYNETIDKMNSKLSEAVYRDYKPLTSEQRKEMDEKDIERWEEKSKSGLLRNDSILISGLNQLRTQIYSPVTGLTSTFFNGAKNTTETINQIANIGITTSTNYRDKGKLIIDEGKLKEAISQNPMAIYDLFNEKVKNTDGTVNYEQSGIAVRMEQVISKTITNIEAKAGKSYSSNSQFTLGRILERVNKDMISFEDRLKRVEARYWRQFNAMEEAINKSNSQSVSLMQQFG